MTKKINKKSKLNETIMFLHIENTRIGGSERRLENM